MASLKHFRTTSKLARNNIVAHRPIAPRSSAPLTLASRCLALRKFRAAPLRSSLQPQSTGTFSTANMRVLSTKTTEAVHRIYDDAVSCWSL